MKIQESKANTCNRGDVGIIGEISRRLPKEIQYTSVDWF